MCYFLNMLWILNYIPLLGFSRVIEPIGCVCVFVCVDGDRYIGIYYKELAYAVMETESPELGEQIVQLQSEGL